MDDIVANLIRSTKVSFSNVLVDKVKETLRRLQSKLPVGCLGKGEKCRSVLALEIACRLVGTPYERKKLLTHSSIGESDYQKAMTTCKAALNINWNFVNVEEVLSLQYNPDVVASIRPILEKYQSMYVNKLSADVRNYVKLESPLYVCAAFCLAASHKQVTTAILLPYL
jgi:hypothetical protein